jgi:uncharacterized phiE125 gp8 family phage protein
MISTAFFNIYRPIRTPSQEYLLTVVTPPAAEPVSSADLAAHLYLTGTEDQSLVNALAAAAREIVETEAKIVLMPTTFDVSFNTFDDAGLRIPVRPVTSVVSVKYLDQTGTLQTLSPSAYDVELRNIYSRVKPKYGTVFPPAYFFPNSVTIRFTAGATTVSPTVVALIKMLTTHLYENRGESAAKYTATIDRLLNLINAPTV